MNTLIYTELLKGLDVEINKNSAGIWEEEPVSPKEFFTNWLQPGLSEPQLDVFDNLFGDGKEWLRNYIEYLLLWGEGCVAGDTILKDEVTGKEYTIKELADKKLKISVRSMIKENGTYKFVVKETGIPFKKGTTKLYKVKTKSGKEIIVSKEHKFYTKDGWKTLGELKETDKIAINSTTIMIKFDEIESIECIGEQDYYDLNVPETHNYIAHDIVNHNSGKDFISLRIILYTSYWLMCLRNPQKYFNFADNEPIDLINVSLSSVHAKDVFFKRLSQAVKLVKNPKTGRNWFAEKGMDLRDGQDVQTSKILFKKNVTAYSLNSQKYTGEGKNILIAIFDEIAEFKPSKAKELYENLWFTAESRWGNKDDSPVRIILLSYLRNEFDFMNYRWKQSELEERVYRSRKTTWEVRPDKTREDFNRAFAKNPEDAARRYGNILSERLGNRFFKYPEKIVENVNLEREAPYIGNMIHVADLNELEFKSWFRPYSIQRLDHLKEVVTRTHIEEIELKLLEARHSDTQYFIHLDLAKGKEGGDCGGIALVHPYLINPEDEDMGVGIYLDLVMQLKGDRGELDFELIRNFIFKLHNLGFPIGGVTADSFGSIEMIQLLNKSGINAELLSVDRTDEAYQTTKELIYSKRLDYYNYPVLLRELNELINVDRKVDHPEVSQRRSIEEANDKGSKDCCFVGGTKVSLVDGRDLSFEELIVEQDKGKENYIYSIDLKRKKVVPKKIKNVFKSGYSKEFIKIKLDNNETITCTLNHPFMLKNGIYKEAKDLKIGDSMMPLYRKINKNHLKGYRMFYNPFEDSWHYEHRQFAKRVPNNNKELVHHYNFNKLDNSPDNLKLMTLKAHSRLHGLLSTPEKLKKLHKGAHLFNISKEGRDKHSKSMKKTQKLIGLGLIKCTRWVQKSDFKGYKDERMKKFIQAGADARRGDGSWCKGLTKETSKSIREAAQKQSIIRLGFDINLYKEDITTKYLKDKKSPKDIGKLLNCSEEVIRQRLKLWGVFSPLHSKEIGRINTIKAKEKKKNHKIIQIQKLTKTTQPIYDLVVEDTHNFALSAGVFVHNSDALAGASIKALSAIELEGDWLGVEL